MLKMLEPRQSKRYLQLLQQGNERGLNFFYQRHYGYLFHRTLRATKDECATASIVQEALLRLWLFRAQINNAEDIIVFLKTQVKTAIQLFYHNSENTFNRSLLRLDAIAGYQDYLLAYEEDEETEIDYAYQDQLEEEKKKRLNQINQLLPSLNTEQQLFIKLCLKYNFNYERIAYYLGGISDYAVSLQVEKAIQTLQSIFTSAQKMELTDRSTTFITEETFDKQQIQIFHMRYALHLSFDQISASLQLSSTTVKQLFIEAHAQIKNSKEKELKEINYGKGQHYPHA